MRGEEIGAHDLCAATPAATTNATLKRLQRVAYIPHGGPGEGGVLRVLVGDLAAANDAASLDAERVTSIVNCCAASCGADAAQWFPRAGAAYAATLDLLSAVVNQSFAPAPPAPPVPMPLDAALWLRAEDAAPADGGEIATHKNVSWSVQL
jgi:hypothetical protein